MAGGKHRPAIAHRSLGYRAVQVLGYVRDYHDRHGHAPSYGTIADALGFMTKADVCKVVARLEKRALLSRAGSGRVRRGSERYKPVLRLPA
jgi:SOS-response transcriptional repressor LexA